MIFVIDSIYSTDITYWFDPKNNYDLWLVEQFRTKLEPTVIYDYVNVRIRG